MSVLPIMISAVVVSISKLLRSREASRYLYKIIFFSTLFFIGVTVIGLSVGAVSISLTGDDSEMKKAIGKMMIAKDENSNLFGDLKFKSLR